MWQPLNQNGSLTARIVAEVEHVVRKGALQPGDRLPSEREMAQLLGVSRPSLREAVRILEAQGRLIVKHGQGVFVQAPPSERELRNVLASIEVTLGELFPMREVLEAPAAAWAAERINDEQLADLRQLLDKMDKIVERNEPQDLEMLRQLDTDFHMKIAGIADNQFLRQASHVLHTMLLAGMETTLSIPGRPQLSRRDHERIYSALARRNPRAARSAAQAHIRAAHAAALGRIEREQAAVGAQESARSAS